MCTLVRSPHLLLLGFALLSSYAFFGASSTSSDEQARGNNIGLRADDSPRGLRRKHGVGALAPLARITLGEDQGGREEAALTQDAARTLVVADCSGQDSEAAAAITTRRRAEGSLEIISQEDLDNLDMVIVLQHEGIVFCPIPKVACSEWSRAFRWMSGIQDWEIDGLSLHRFGRNGLEQLTRRGLEETRWAFQTDRFFRFVVVREPVERMVSAFLNKCVLGYDSGLYAKHGIRGCEYITIMPELFPDTPITSPGTPETHARLKELVEADPEDTFFHFVSGIWREAEARGDTCKIDNFHLRPQACFCDLVNLLPAFHVIPFANMSAEAEALADRLPAALPDSGVDLEGHAVGADGMDAVTASRRITGVDKERREEIRAFLRQRFTEYHKEARETVQGITHAKEHEAKFLSERVIEVIHKITAKDYDLLGEYF